MATPAIVLLTGFEPFDEYPINPSQLIVEQLRGTLIGGALVIGAVLPVEFGEDAKLFLPLIDRFEPTAVISLGLMAGASTMNVEMFAVNHRCVERGNDVLVPIIEGAPAAYFATLDVDRVGKSIGDRAGVPVTRHGYAGSYLCNHIFYQALHYTAVNAIPTKTGFIHLTFCTEQLAAGMAAQTPSLPLEKMVMAVNVAIEEAVAG